MRIKFLSVIAGFLLLSIAVCSCLDSDNTYEYSSDATMHAFGIDTIYGKYYPFTIDQLNNLIYNKDSLPVGADTIIDKILIDTMSVSGWVTSGMPTDTLFSTADSVNLLPAMNPSGSNGMQFKVHAYDGITTRDYTLQIRVHLQDPDSLDWREITEYQIPKSNGSFNSVLLNDELWIYLSETTAYKASVVPSRLQGEVVNVRLPQGVDMGSIISSNLTDEIQNGTASTLYAVADGKVYRSENGIDWECETALGNRVKRLIPALRNTLTGIVEVNGQLYFNISRDGKNWLKEACDTNGQVQLSQVDDTFPLEGIYASRFTTANGVEQAILVGTPRGEETVQTLLWFSEDGCDWTEMSSIRYEAYCPQMQHPVVMYYGGLFYSFGDKLNTMYSSTTGIVWRPVERKFLLPEEFKDNAVPYSVTVDANHFIWVVFGGEDTETIVWRGRLNKLGFKE